MYMRGDWRRGDWCRTLPFSSGARRCRLPVCQERTKPLGARPPAEIISTLPPRHFFGPVHAVQCFEDYIAVRVPRYADPTVLIWIQVQRGNTPFAQRINAAAAWPGWRNAFRD
jgi:hypothetical protein